MLRLAMLPGLGPIRIGRLLDAFGSPDRALGASVAAWAGVPGIGEPTARRALAAIPAADEAVRVELDLAESRGVTLLAHGQPGYPTLLAPIPDAPRLLYLRGRLEPAGEDRYPLAVVGSRRCTQYGIEQAERFAGVLARAGLTIVSGGARGIDTAAHRGALRAGGRTIVVQGCGLAGCYPPENAELFERIVAEDRGAILSELPMTAEPRAEQFPARNRIISGLSLGVLVIEAGERSGALITARLAAEEHGREVLVVPGRVDSTASAGSLALLRQGGAAIAINPGDVLDALESPARFTHQGLHDIRYGDPAASTPDTSPGSDDNNAILQSLSSAPASADEIARATGLGADRVRAALTILELTGRVTRIGGAFARRSP
jgi:DNA processing protein